MVDRATEARRIKNTEIFIAVQEAIKKAEKKENKKEENFVELRLFIIFFLRTYFFLYLCMYSGSAEYLASLVVVRFCLPS